MKNKSIKYSIINILRKIINFPKIFSKKTSYGSDYSDKYFYIVGFPRKEDGLLFIVLCNLSHICYSVKKGYIPVIDQQYFDDQYKISNELFPINSWEIYFNQPFGYKLEDIKNSKNIILSNKLQMPNKYFTINFDIFDDIQKLSYFKEMYNKYINFNKKTMDYLISSYNMIFNNKTNILGILCRGTDYLLKKPGGHPIQPEPRDVIKKADELLIKYNCNYIYLATEDQDIFEMFQSHFGNKLITNNQRRFSQKDFNQFNYISQIIKTDDNEKYNLGLDYLSTLYNLSKCDYFIGGKTAGTIGVYLMSNNFIFNYVWELGYYPLPSIVTIIKQKLKKIFNNE